MLISDRDAYEETKDIVLGRRKKSLLLEALSEWFRVTYGVTVLNFRFETVVVSHTDKYRLSVILQGAKDNETMREVRSDYVKDYQSGERVKEEFRRLALTYGYADSAQLEEMFVVYNDFTDAAMVRTNWAAAREVEAQIQRAFPSVWRVAASFAASVVFYYTDADVHVCAANGTSETITDTYYSVLKTHDELDVFTRDNIALQFDSKENLDKNYEGNFYYYFH